MTSSSKSAETPLAAGGGLKMPPVGHADPYQALDELMLVVESLCPEWPERPPFPSTARFIL